MVSLAGRGRAQSVGVASGTAIGAERAACRQVLGSGFRRSDEYTATGPVDAFDTSSFISLNRYQTSSRWCSSRVD